MNNKNDQTQLNELIDLAGEIAELFSFNRSIGQIYAFLYFCQDPVALEDIAINCKMSKGNASLLLRTLLDWEAVRLSSKTGTRKDYYVANKNLQALAFKRLNEGVSKRLTHVQQRIQTLKTDGRKQSAHSAQLNEVEELISKVQKALNVLPQLLELKKFLF